MHLDLTTIATGELKRALKINSELGGADSEKGTRLVNIVRVIKSLREALAVGLWERVHDIIVNAVEQQGLMHPELTAARIECGNMLAIQALESSLSRDSASGNIGELLGNPTIAFTELDAAIDQAQCITDDEAVEEMPKLIACAQRIRTIRCALRESDLEALGSAVGFVAEDGGAGSFTKISFGVGWNPKSQAEYLQAKHEYIDASACNDLKNALDAGAISGEPGALELPSKESMEDTARHLKGAQELVHTSLQTRRLLRSGNTIQRVRSAAIAGSWHELDILLRSTKITTSIHATETSGAPDGLSGRTAKTTKVATASDPELLIQDTQRAEWNMLAAHAKYFVLRCMMVKAMEVGQVSFMSDGQIGYSSISSQSLVDAIDPCVLAAEIASAAAANSMSAAVGNQHLNTYKFHALSVAGSTILHMRRAIKDQKWKDAVAVLREFKETQALLRSDGGANAIREELSNAGGIAADAKVCISDGLVVSAMTEELSLMERAIKIGEASQTLLSHLVDASKQIRGAPGVVDLSGVDCNSLESATVVARSLISSSETPLTWLMSLVAAADSMLRIRSGFVKQKIRQKEIGSSTRGDGNKGMSSVNDAAEEWKASFAYSTSSWSDYLDMCVDQANAEPAVHHHCEDELALIIRERRYQHGILGLERLADALRRALVKASSTGSTNLGDYASEASRTSAGNGHEGEKIGSDNAEKSSPKPRRPTQRRGSFVESLIEIRQSAREEASSGSNAGPSSPLSDDKQPSSPTYRSLTFEHVLAALRLESDYASVHIRTAVTLAEWCHSLSLSLQARDFKQVQILVDRFVTVKDRVDNCPNNQRFLFSVDMLSRLAATASAFCKNQFLKIKLKQALQLELPSDAYDHVDVDLVTFAELERILVEIRSSKRKLLKNDKEYGESSEEGDVRVVQDGLSGGHGSADDGDEMLIQSSELTILSETAKVVLRMRKAMVKQDWDTVEGVISEAITMVEQGRFNPLGVQEISIVETELMNRRAFNLLHGAIFSTGKDQEDVDIVANIEEDASSTLAMSSSSVMSSMEELPKLDGISVSSNDVSLLALALEQITIDDLEISSDIVQRVVNLCQVLLELRRARVAEDWRAVDRVLGVADSLHESGIHKRLGPNEAAAVVAGSDDLDVDGNRFVMRVFELQRVCLQLIEGSRKVLRTKEMRDKIIKTMTSVIEEKCFRRGEDDAESGKASPSSKAMRARDVGQQDELGMLISASSKDPTFMHDQSNLVLMAAVQHLLTVCRLIGRNHQTRNNCEEAWAAVLSAESHATDHSWPQSASLALKSLKRTVQISRVEKRLIHALKNGQVRTRSFEHDDQTHQDAIMFGRSDVVVHFLDRRNISTEGIDEALAFSVHASVEKGRSPTSSPVSKSDPTSSSSSFELDSSLQALLASVRLVRRARVSCMPGANFPRAFEPGNSLSKLLLDSSLSKTGAHPAARQELQLIRTAALNAFLHRSLATALSRGGPQGALGSLVLDCVDTVGLKQALHGADAVHPSNDFEVFTHVRILLESARRVLAVRTAAAEVWCGRMF